MIRATLTDGRYLLGLDAENVRRLRDGKPIAIDLSHMGGHDALIIMYGDTQSDILKQLEGATGGPLPPAMPFHDPGDKPQ